jgi:polyisoprenoid-binding protein YceI
MGMIPRKMAAFIVVPPAAIDYDDFGNRRLPPVATLNGTAICRAFFSKPGADLAQYQGRETMTFRIFRNVPAMPCATFAVILSLAVLPSISGAQAEPRKQEVDLDHTTIFWTVSHGGFTKVTYQFRKINKVDFMFDQSDVSKSSVKVEIEAASLDSNHAFRDNWARSEAELNVWKFRTITFESTKIEKTGDNVGRMIGNLTMHGVTQPITMNITYNKGGKHVSGKFSIDGFSAQGKLKRVDFELKAFTPWIGDEIEFSIQFEALRPNDPT